MSEEEGGGGASASGVTKEFSRLLSAMEGIQSQMQAMKRELSEDRDAADERLVKKIRMDKGLQFKRKSHEKQHNFNEQVLDKIEAAQKSLSSTPPAVDKAKEALKKGEKAIVSRQKLIRIADRSEYGWATVEEYEEDELADGSDDEKRLYKAEMRARRKVRAVKQKKGRKDLPRRDWGWKQKLQSAQASNALCLTSTTVPQPSSSGVARPIAGPSQRP